jgi:rubrerythrin
MGGAQPNDGWGTKMARLRTVVDVLDFAIGRELESHRFYLDLAQMAVRDEVRGMIRRLAAEELQHCIHLQAIKAGEVAFASDDEVGSLQIEETLPEVEPGPKMSYADLLVIGMKKEQAAFRLYTNLASIAANHAQRDVLKKIAQEEAQHKLRLELEYDWATF